MDTLIPSPKVRRDSAGTLWVSLGAPKNLRVGGNVSVDTHGQSPWHFTGQASLDLNPDPPATSHTQ